MATEEEKGQEQAEIPRGQRFFDNLLWLLVISLGLSFLLYNGWGLIELARLPWVRP